MVGDFNGRSRPYYFRRCKKERSIPTSIDSLPDELLFSILVGMPADFLHDSAKFVCRRWIDIIHSQSFIDAHYQRSSTYCLLLFYNYSSVRTILMMTATSPGLIQTNDFSYKFSKKFLGTCNGLVLERISNSSTILNLQIINQATMQALLLPPFSAPVGTKIRNPLCGIAYVAASMKYKVAISYVASSPPLPQSAGLAILTVGVDNSWRRVRVDQYLSEQHARELFSKRQLLITEGFMHWVMQIIGEMVLTLDVETVILTVSKVPSPPQNDEEYYIMTMFYLSTGRSLSLLIGQYGLYGEYMRFFELWEMNPETKEWMKLVDDIMLGDQQQQLRLQQLGIMPGEDMRPHGWLKYPKVLLFSGKKSIMSHNIMI